MTTSKLKSDIAAIECDADGCVLEIEHTDDSFAEVQYARGVNVYVKKGEAKLYIKQKKGLFAKIFGGESAVKVMVPGHIVPAIKIAGLRTDCTIDGGIYGDVEFLAESGSLKAENAAMESCTVNAANCTTHLNKCTVKGSFISNTEGGDITLEYIFATHITCRAKSGNIGAVQLNCKDSTFEAAEGNISATILGDESRFDVLVNSKEGTCNRESVNIEDNDSTFKAYAVKGNILVDFTDGKEN